MNNFVTNKSKLPQNGAQVFPYMGWLAIMWPSEESLMWPSEESHDSQSPHIWGDWLSCDPLRGSHDSQWPHIRTYIVIPYKGWYITFKHSTCIFFSPLIKHYDPPGEATHRPCTIRNAMCFENVWDGRETMGDCTPGCSLFTTTSKAPSTDPLAQQTVFC